MVQILTPPTRLEAACKKCGAGLGYEVTEIQTGTSYDYRGDYEAYWYIVCPACENKVTVPRR